MKNHPIHENLDTSFVNVSALVRYLRRRQFVGNVRIELSGYEAEIFLSEGNALRVREYDRIAGRIGEGEEALQRILIRSREPGGIVNVYQAAEEEKNTENETEKIPNPFEKFKPSSVLTATAANGNAQPALPEEIADEKPRSKNLPPNLPFEFTNKVEAKAKQSNVSPNDWQMILNLTGELLGTFDKTLAAGNLNFTAAFLKARTEISGDYPFLNPTENIFEYKNGEVIMREQRSAKLFTASILEVLRRMLEKLGANPKFAELHRAAIQKLLALLYQRRPLYDRFSITKPLEKILGV